MRILVVLLMLLGSVAEATHLRSGFITIRRTAPGSLTCEITLTVYVNTDSEIEFGAGELSFGDGEHEVPADQPSVARPDLGPGIGMAVYTTAHTYDAPGRYVVDYVEANRSGSVNMFNALETPFYIDSFVDLNVGGSPALTFVAPAVFSAGLDRPVSVGLGVAAESDYRFQYALIPPKRAMGSEVMNYRFPIGASINPFNGHFTWDLGILDPQFGTAPGPGAYGFAMRITVFDLNGRFVGYVVFDFQVNLIVGGGFNGRISFSKPLDSNGRVFTETQDSVKVVFEADSPTWSMNLYTELPDDVVSMTTKDSTANGKYYKVSWLKYNNMESIHRANPYVVVVRAKNGQHSYDLTSLFFTTDTDFTDVITGVEKEASRNIRLFPNPFNRFLNVQGNSSGGGTLSVFKLTGEHVLTVKWTEGQSVDLSELPSGFYVARIDGQAFRIVKRYSEP